MLYHTQHMAPLCNQSEEQSQEVSATPYLELVQPVEIAFKNRSIQDLPGSDLWQVTMRLQVSRASQHPH